MAGPRDRQCSFILEFSTLSSNTKSNTLVQRYVNVPCPSGNYTRSIVTFRNHTVAAMFCIPCEVAWTELTNRPELLDLGLDTARS